MCMLWHAVLECGVTVEPFGCPVTPAPKKGPFRCMVVRHQTAGNLRWYFHMLLCWYRGSHALLGAPCSPSCTATTHCKLPLLRSCCSR